MLNKIKSSSEHNVKVVRCLHCDIKVLDIESGSKPFKPSATPVAINLKCARCGKPIRLELGNA